MTTTLHGDNPMDSPTRRRSLRDDIRRVKPRWVVLAVLVTFAGSHMVSQINIDSDDYGSSNYDSSDYDRDRSWVKTAPPDWQARQRHNQHAIRNLAVGTPRPEALANLGSPDFEEQYGQSVDLVFYRTSSARQDWCYRIGRRTQQCARPDWRANLSRPGG